MERRDIRETPKDYSEIQIMDTIDDYRGNMPRDFMQSLDGSLERMLKSCNNGK